MSALQNDRLGGESARRRAATLRQEADEIVTVMVMLAKLTGAIRAGA